MGRGKGNVWAVADEEGAVMLDELASCSPDDRRG